MATAPSTNTSLSSPLTVAPGRLASIAYYSVGIQTEAGAAPYSRVVNAGGASGLSVGVFQNDFKQHPSTAASYAQAVFDWMSSQGTTPNFTETQFTQALKSAGLSADMGAAARAFGESSTGASWIHQNFDVPHLQGAIQAAERAFSTPYGQALLREGTHVEEFAAFAMKVYNQYGPGVEGANGTAKSPGFGALMDYLNNGAVVLKDNRVGHEGQTIPVFAGSPGQFNLEDLRKFSESYAETRKTFNAEVQNGPIRALNSGNLYKTILDSDSTLTDALLRQESKGDYSPGKVLTDPDAAVARAIFGADTAQMKRAVGTINDATTIDPQQVNAPLGQFGATIWIDPVDENIAVSYRGTSGGYVVSSDGFTTFSSSSIIKEGGIRTLKIAQGGSLVGFATAATPNANSPLPMTGGVAVQQPSPGQVAPTDYPSTSRTIEHLDGSTTYEWKARADSIDVSIKKGDLVSVTYDTDGQSVLKTIWHADGSVEQTSVSDDRKSKTFTEWDKYGNKQTELTTSQGEDTPHVIGEFILNGQRYREDGSPVLDPGQPVAPAVDPITVTPPPDNTPSETSARQEVDASLAGLNYGLGSIDASPLPETALGFVPAGNTAQILDDLRARGFAVEVSGEAIFAQKGDEYIIISDGTIEMGKGGRYGRIDLVNDSLVLQDSDYGESVRYVLSELAGAKLLVKGTVQVPTADDTDVDLDSLAVDMIQLDGQPALEPGAYAFDPQDLEAYGFTFNNLTNGALPRTATNLITGLNPATIAANGWASPQVMVTSTADGGSIRAIELGSGITLSTVRDSDRRVLSVTETQDLGAGAKLEIVRNGAGQLVSRTHTDYFYDESGVSRTETITTAGGTVRNTYDSDNQLFKTETLADTVSARASVAAQTASELIQFGQLLNSHAPGIVKLASGAVLLNNVAARANPDGSGLFNTGTGQVLGGMVSLYNLSNAWKYGDGLAKTSATLNSLNFVNQTLISNGLGSTALGTSLNGGGLANGTPGVLPALGLASAIKAKDPIGMVQSAIGLFNPTLLFNPAIGFTPLGWVLLAASVLKALSDKGPPDAWGTANVTFGEGITNYGTVVNAVGENFGPQRVRNQLANTLDALNGLIHERNAANPDSSQHLGVIPQRLPSLNFKAAEFADPGYAVADIDMLSGAQRFHDLRFDDDGRPFGSAPEQITPELRQMLSIEGAPGFPQLNAYLLNSALQRGAIAPLWEVRTAKMQQLAGDPNAGLSEQERAAKAGLGAAVDSAYAQSHPDDANASNKRVGHFMPIGIDLDRSGSVAARSIAQTEAHGTPISFDWDGLGYHKPTGWIAAEDGFLVLDRNFNGSVDNASELLSNPLVADAAKGLRSLAAFDANADGRIDASDPVYAQLQVWQDLNQDGNNTHSLQLWPDTELAQDESNGVRELRSLSDWGITAIDYANSRYEFRSASGPDGVGYASILTQTLEAEQEGTRYTPVGAGIRIDATDGRPEIVITQVRSEQAVYAQYTLEAAGETIGTPQSPLYEDGVPQAYNPSTQGGPIAITISAAQLLANDTWHGAAGAAAGLTITSVGNASHGTVGLREDGNIGLRLEANYHGPAGFDYTVTSPDGQTRSARVTFNVTPVNDVPSVAVQLDQRNIYGYGVLAKGEWVGGNEDRHWGITEVERNVGLPQLKPYLTVLGREQVGTQTVGNGDGISFEPVFGDLVDTLIPKTYFDEQYASVAGAYSTPESGPAPAFLQFKMDSALVKVDVGAGTVWHDVPVAVETTNDGYVGASDPDGPAQFSYEVVAQPLYGSVELNGTTGRFEYTGRRYVDQNVKGENIGGNVKTDDAARLEQRFTDYFTVRARDGAGGFTDQRIGVIHHGPPANPAVEGSGGKKPIAIDLDGNGFAFTDVDDSNVFFDVNGDGWKRRIAWTRPGDGLIAFDKDGNGRIESFDEIAFVGYAPGQQTDLAALRQAFDSNANGVLDAGDEKWSRFGVWQDANSNGVTDGGEYRTLSEMGISTIGLASDSQFQVIDGQTVHGLALATRTDGSTLTLADVTLRTSNQVQLPAASGSSMVTVSKYGQGRDFVGTADKDLVFGTAASDAFHTADGNDVIVDDGGNDLVEAGAGDDLVYSGIDNDIVNAGAGDDTVFAGAGNDLVFGDGANEAGDDLLMLENGNDVAFGGAGNDFIDGGPGNDVLSGNAGDDKLFGEDGWDALFGQEGDDELWGMAGNDLLYGEQGNDLLAGGEGDDVMEGGIGDDTYEVDSSGDTVIELAGEGTDTVRSAIGYTLADTLENLTLTGEQNLSGTGNAGDNVLAGNSGNNRLSGLAGNDLLDGGLGADLMLGGVGDDTYVIDHAGDQVIEVAGEGQDTVRSRITTTLAQNVENLTLIGINAIDGAGNELDNVLTGNAAANRLDGGAGADLMRGGRGDDTYLVDNAGDVVVEMANEGTDTVLASTNYTLSAHVENLTLTGNAVSAIGNQLDNILHGSAQANLLDGAAGADQMAGAAGDDTYVVDSASDAIEELAGEGTDTVLASVSYILSANVENLTLTGAADIDAVGNDLANILTGNAGANRLDGLAGADTMAGGAGDDTYVVNDAGDTIEEQAGQGVDSVISSVSHALAAEVENLTLTGNADFWATGNWLDNVLIGNAGNNALAGGAGNDTYVYTMGGGLDTITDTSGVDTVSFGPGLTLDNIALRIATVGGQKLAQIRVLDATGSEVTDQGIDYVMGIDAQGRLSSALESFVFADGSSYLWSDLLIKSTSLTGTPGADLLIGGRNDDLIDGGNGNDALYGTSGHDRLLGGNGNDLLFAGGGNDKLYGGNGDDELYGEAGDDLLDGDNGTDLLLDLQGNNSFYAGNDDDTVIAGAGNDIVHAGNGRDVVQAGAGADRIDSGNDNDLVDAGIGDDFIASGNGDDWMAAGRGNDLIDGGNGRNLYAFNRGDGADILGNSGNGRDTISLGGRIRYADLSLAKAGNDLVLGVGSGDSMTLKNWYVGNNAKGVARLQVITVGGDYDASSSDKTRNQQVELFDFAKLVQKFDAARAANTANANGWAVMNSLLAAHLQGSDTAALGGDLSFQYATTGSLGGIGLSAAQSSLAAGTGWQTLKPRSELEQGSVRLI